MYRTTSEAAQVRSQQIERARSEGLEPDELETFLEREEERLRGLVYCTRGVGVSEHVLQADCPLAPGVPCSPPEEPRLP